MPAFHGTQMGQRMQFRLFLVLPQRHIAIQAHGKGPVPEGQGQGAGPHRGISQGRGNPLRAEFRGTVRLPGLRGKGIQPLQGHNPAFQGPGPPQAPAGLQIRQHRRNTEIRVPGQHHRQLQRQRPPHSKEMRAENQGRRPAPGSGLQGPAQDRPHGPHKILEKELLQSGGPHLPEP